MKYAKAFREYFSTKTVFSVRDVRNRFADKKISPNYANVLLNHFLERKEISRVARGFYSFKTDPNVIAFAIQPSYFGLQDALSFQGLWEQQTIPVLVTPRKIRSGFRTVLETRVLVRRINRKQFFGFEMKKYLDFWVPVSDLEKTLIDFFYFNQPLEKKILQKMLKKSNHQKLLQYLKKTPKKTRKKIEKMLYASKTAQ
jgi:predicted transcriptional regulator of viral defense system